VVDEKFTEHPGAGYGLTDEDMLAAQPDMLSTDALLSEPAAAGVVNLPRLARKLQGQSRRYLLQVRCDSRFASDSNDPSGDLLTALAKPIDVLGAQIEEHWAASSEYDLILILRLQSHQVSLGTVEMALTAMPEVRALRSTPLYALNPPDGSLMNWKGLLAEALTSDAPEPATGRDADPDETLGLLHADEGS
jgi:hypothetical protein